MAELTRIVIVDDHPFVREGLKQLLAGQNEFQLAGEASSIADARTAISSQNPDVAVVDLALGADDGVDLVRWIRSSHPNVRVLVLSMQDEALYAERLLRLGVSGYVMKNVAGTDFLAGSADGTGTDALFNSPQGLTDDGAGTVYVADASNHTIRKVVVSTGVVTTLPAARVPGARTISGTWIVGS